jgi:hypothetical protein
MQGNIIVNGIDEPQTEIGEYENTEKQNEQIHYKQNENTQKHHVSKGS